MRMGMYSGKKHKKQRRQMRMVMYSGNEEVLVCLTGKGEKNMLKIYFGINTGRNVEEYDREEMPDEEDVIAIRSSIDASRG